MYRLTDTWAFSREQCLYGLGIYGCLNEMVRVTKPGGHILYSLRTDAYESMGFEGIVKGLDADGKWQLLEKKGHQSFPNKDQEDQEVVHDIWVYQVL